MAEHQRATGRNENMGVISKKEFEGPEDEGFEDILLFTEGEKGKEVDFVLALDPKTIKEMKRLRHDVYLRCSFIDKPYPDRIIPDDADNKQAIYIAARAGNDIIGSIRLAAPPFKVLEELGSNLYEDAESIVEQALKDGAVELGSLAVRQESGYSRISGGLYKAVYLVCNVKGIRWWFIDIDERVYNALLRLGWKVTEIGPRHEYMGSTTVPGVMNTQEQTQNIKKSNPAYFEYLKNVEL